MRSKVVIALCALLAACAAPLPTEPEQQVAKKKATQPVVLQTLVAVAPRVHAVRKETVLEAPRLERLGGGQFALYRPTGDQRPLLILWEQGGVTRVSRPGASDPVVLSGLEMRVPGSERVVVEAWEVGEHRLFPETHLWRLEASL